MTTKPNPAGEPTRSVTAALLEAYDRIGVIHPDICGEENSRTARFIRDLAKFIVAEVMQDLSNPQTESRQKTPADHSSGDAT